MMKRVEGDLIEMFDNGEFDAIVHGCNCFCRMRSGIAKTITDRWPEVAKVDSSTKVGDIGKLGTTQEVWVERKCKNEGLIINAYTQYNYGNDGQRYVDYCAVKDAFYELNVLFGNTSFKIGIPMIGAGLAGGNWRTICDTIEFAAPQLDITVVEFKQ